MRDLARRALDQRSSLNGRITVVIAAVLGFCIVLGLPEMWRSFPSGIDLEIPLRAASRWAAHGQPYPPEAMLVQGGPDLPFLYPPFVLPFLAPISSLPRDLVLGVWLLLCDLCAIWTCRRIGLPWIAVPFALAWPPFAEGLLTGNVQIWSFAAFAALFFDGRLFEGGLTGGFFGTGRAGTGVPGDGPARASRERGLIPGRDALNGVLAATVGALKVAQSLPLLFLLRRRPRAAVTGVVALAVLVAGTLPLVGVAAYGDWFAQLRRAADPAWSWTIGGVAPGHFLGTPDILFTVVAVAITLLVRGRDSVAWLGIALILVSPSVHGYTFLFLLPALLTLRRDLALLIAALFLGDYMATQWWLATILAALCLLAMNRCTWLRMAETPVSAGSDGAPADALNPRARAIAPDTISSIQSRSSRRRAAVEPKG